MGSPSMEDRKKAGPFGPKWQKVKGKNKALTGKSFKPDLTPVIERYDQTLKDYDALIAQRDQLRKSLQDLLKSNETFANEISEVKKTLADLEAKFNPAAQKHLAIIRKYAEGGDAELNDVDSALTNLNAAAEEFINNRKQAWTDWDGIAYNHLKESQKIEADFSKKVSAALDAMSKLASVAISAETEAESIIRDYIDIAQDIDHPEIVKDLQSLKF